DSDDEGLDVGSLLEELDAQRALTDDDVAVVVGVDHDGTLAIGVLGGHLQAYLDTVARENDLGSVSARCEKLRHRHTQRHVNGGLDAQLLGRESNALSVVTRRGSDDSASALLFRETREAVGCTAHLERSGALQ